VGNPTIDGVRHVLRRVNDGGRRPVLWQNMREEPVVYINGKPFVLREVERPFKNMLEYTVSAEGCEGSGPGSAEEGFLIRGCVIFVNLGLS
jgi:hypothetical protein